MIRFFIFGFLFIFMSGAQAFTFGVPEQIIHLNPFGYTPLTAWKIDQLVFDFLLIEKPGQRDVFRSGLAQSWSISKDKKIYTFELRQTKWSDGTALTTDDIKFSLEHIFDPRYKSEWKESFQDVDRIEIISKTKFRIHTKVARYELWKNLAVVLRILPKHFYGDPDSKIYNQKMLGSGPYQISDFKPGKTTSLQKNRNWWGWKDVEVSLWYRPEKIVFKTVLNETSALNYLQKNEIDAYSVSNQIKISDKNAFHFIKDPNQNKKNVEHIFLNLKNILFQNIQVRKALGELIHRALLCQSSESFSAKPSLDLLKKLGWHDTNKDGILDKNKVSFDFEVIYDSPDDEIILTTLSENLKPFGIRIRPQYIDPSLLWKTLNDKKFQAFIDRRDENQTVLASEWHSQGSYNVTGFSSESVDQQLIKLDQTFESDRRKVLIQDLHKKISGLFASLRLCEIKSFDYIVKATFPQADIKLGTPLWGWVTE